mgnify:CR=1 FL=1
MKLTWLGHSGFRLEIEGAVILIDPWLSGNPVFPADRRDEAVRGAAPGQSIVLYDGTRVVGSGTIARAGRAARTSA